MNLREFRLADAETRLHHTEFLVEATHTERLSFWEDHFDQNHLSEKAKESNRYHCFDTWDQISPGYVVEAGRVYTVETPKSFMEIPKCIKPWPVVIDLSWNYIDGYYVCFWESVSMVSHMRIAENWLSKHFPKYHSNRCNSMNFAQCIHTLKVLQGK